MASPLFLHKLYNRLKAFQRPFYSRYPVTNDSLNLSCIPFFIIGSGRSGNTLLRSILSGSPNISIKINWKRYISSFNKTEIGIKIDGKNYTWLSFNLDKTGQISFQNPSTHSNELINKFKKITKLAVEIEPYSEPPINVYFNLSGFASHLENLKSICSQ